MIFIARPDYEEYELADGLVVSASSPDEALKIIENQLEDDEVLYRNNTPQKWSVEVVNESKKGILLQSINW